MSASGHTIASEVGRDGGAPSDLLHEAAAKMRARAQAADTGNTWESYVQDCDVHVGGIDDGPHVALIGRQSWPYVPAQGEHIASWHPAVARAVADLVACPCEDHADVVARAYLGRES